jgi:hypothetical protein
VAALVALAEPPALVAVTVQVMALSASARASRYVEAVAPPMLTPARFHW